MKKETNVYDKTYEKLNKIVANISEISRELYHIQRGIEDESLKPKNAKICGIAVSEGVCESMIMVRGQLTGAALMLMHDIDDISNCAEMCFDSQNLPWDTCNELSALDVISTLEDDNK